ncbi:MAG: DUF2934 domain-containing protein [Candidatus Acidiferrales bacterium]
MAKNNGAFPTREQIQERAYEIYLERGRQDGDDRADWLAAERELMELRQAPIDGSAAGEQAGVLTNEQRANGATEAQTRADMEEILRETHGKSRATAA